MEQQDRTVERIAAELARRAHGNVSRAQLLSQGVSAEEIRHRLHTGAWIRVYRGVYRVGHQAPSLEARYLAAVLACGEEAVLTGLAGAHLFAIVKGSPPPPEVISPTERRIPGVKTRRSRLNPRDVTTHRAIPVTTIPRTLVDIAGQLDEDDLARACHEAQVRFRTRPEAVEAVLARRPNARGAARLRRILRGDAHVTLSKLERGFVALLRKEVLPLPVTNRPAGGRYVDCRWPEHRLTLELDSYRFHHSRHAWEQDRRREREAYARGDQFRRYTWGDVFENPRLMLAELRTLLGC